MDSDTAKAYFNHPDVVADYAQAVNRVGLWRSEEKIFTRLFKPDDTLLELGCGAGRIAFGLWELGYRHILGIDYAREMIEEARRINRVLEYGVSFRVGDATKLSLGDAEFDGAIFGFNGLMQIPHREKRLAALREIRRVTKPGAWLVFTAHNRANEKFGNFWPEEQQRWDDGTQTPGLHDFGDRIVETPQGPMFIHVPSREELLAGLAATGWRHEVDVLYSVIAQENDHVRAFTDDTYFWVAQHPG